MSTRSEITELEERLRQAELGPDPAFFQEALADEAVLVGQDGQPAMPKAKVVQAHQPGSGPKFTRVEMSDMQIVEHDSAAVVTCKGDIRRPERGRHAQVHARVAEAQRTLADHRGVDLELTITWLVCGS